MKITVFGEVLWDIFGEKKEIGGAPFNFAAHFSSLGGNASLISAVGNDELGLNAVKNAEEIGIDTNAIATVPYPTGYCAVTLNNGTPSYDLVKNTAYDFIPLPDKDFLRSDALYFGTLAQRNSVSRSTLEQVLNGNYGEVFFDINIRGDFYSDEIIDRSLKKTTVFKISREEIGVLKIDGTNEDICKKLKAKYPMLKLIIVTLDCDGSFVYDCASDRFFYSEKPNVKVVSTVGAGDSFSACFLYNYLSGAEVQTCLARASEMANYVITKLGAVPKYTDELLNKVK